MRYLIVYIDGRPALCKLTNTETYSAEKTYTVKEYHHRRNGRSPHIQWGGSVHRWKKTVRWVSVCLPQVDVEPRGQLESLCGGTNDNEWKEDVERGLLFFRPNIKHVKFEMTLCAVEGKSRIYCISTVRIAFPKSVKRTSAVLDGSLGVEEKDS